MNDDAQDAVRTEARYEQVIELSEQASLSAQKANSTHQHVQQVRHL